MAKRILQIVGMVLRYAVPSSQWGQLRYRGRTPSRPPVQSSLYLGMMRAPSRSISVRFPPGVRSYRPTDLAIAALCQCFH